MKYGVLALLLVPALGCATDDASTDGAPLPQTSGSFLGRYAVPTTADFAAAATFVVDDVDWTVTAGTATLHYNLPRGLVGGKLAITLSGAIGPGATTVELAGAQGTGECTATAALVTCRETFGDLGALPISLDVVQQVAASEYAGPASDRVHVAGVFGSDPIGTVSIVLGSPVVDDGGSGHAAD